MPGCGRRDLKLTSGALAIAVVGALGELILYVGPILLGAAVDGVGFTPGQAGYVVSAEFGASAFAALALSLRKYLPNPRGLAILSTALLVICDGISFVTNSQAVFVLCRVIAALGAGALFAIGSAAAAASPNPQRLYSLMMFTAVFFSSLIYLFSPPSVAEWGPRGPFLLLVMLSLIVIPAVFALPSAIKREVALEKDTKPIAWPASLSLIAIFMLYAAQSGLWAYVERIGDGAGISLNAIALVLTANGFIALGAAVLADRIGLRVGFILPVLAGMCLQAASAAVLARAPSIEAFAFGAIGFTFGLIFVVPFFKAWIARFDGSGRLAALATALITMGSAAGPAVIGYSLDNGLNYIGASWVAIAGMTLATILFLLSCRSSTTKAPM